MQFDYASFVMVINFSHISGRF